LGSFLDITVKQKNIGGDRNNHRSPVMGGGGLPNAKPLKPSVHFHKQAKKTHTRPGVPATTEEREQKKKGGWGGSSRPSKGIFRNQ